MEHYYFKFNKGDRAVLTETIRSKCFVGSFKEIFKTKPSSYRYITTYKDDIVTILKTPNDKAKVDSAPWSYDIGSDDGNIIRDVPEHILQKK